MAKNRKFRDRPEPSTDRLSQLGQRPSPALPESVVQALQAMQRLRSGELEYLVEHASLAGLETAVVLAVTPGGLIPLFAHVSPDILPVLFPVAERGDRERGRAAARTHLN